MIPGVMDDPLAIQIRDHLDEAFDKVRWQCIQIEKQATKSQIKHINIVVRIDVSGNASKTFTSYTLEDVE